MIIYGEINASSDAPPLIQSRPLSSLIPLLMESTSTLCPLAALLAPLLFTSQDYWPVLEEIQNLCRNYSGFASDLRCMSEDGDTFGGTFSTHKRLSYFNHSVNDSVELPCGFFKQFLISNSDLIEMENCNGVVVVSAIFDDHDKIRQPKGLGSQTLDNDVDMAIPKHPVFIHTMEETMATARWKKWWDVKELQRPMETYCKNGLQPLSSNKPYPTDLPNTAIILRKHGLRNNLFSCLLYNELEAFNPRDELPFAYVRDLMSPKPELNMFEEEVFEQIAAEYSHNV